MKIFDARLVFLSSAFVVAVLLTSPTSAAQDSLRASHLKRGWSLYQAGHKTAAIGELEKALRNDSTRALPYVLLGTVLVQTGEVSRAAKISQAGLAKFPGDERLLRLRASALFKSGRRDDMLPVFRKLYQLEPDDVNVGITYGQLLLKDREPAEAQRVFEALLEKFPRERALYDALVSLNIRRLNYAGAIEVLRREREQFPDDIGLAMRLGGLLESTGAYTAAREVYRDAQSRAPGDSLGPSLAIAASYSEQDSLSAAAAVYRSILSKEPEQMKALVGLGATLQKQNLWQEALGVYQRLSTVNGAAPIARYKMGVAYEAIDKPEAALDAYRHAIRLDVPHPGAYFRRAVLIHRLEGGGFQEAEHALWFSFAAVANLQQSLVQDLQEQSPTGRARSDRTRRFETLNRIADESFMHFISSFAFSKTEPAVAALLEEYEQAARLRFLAGEYYQKNGLLTRARSLFSDAIRRSPALYDAHVALAKLDAQQGNIRDAILSFERARALDESAPEAYSGLIRLYRESGRLDVLIRRWQARLRAAPNKSVLREHLIEALHKAGRYEDARAIMLDVDDANL